MPASLYRAHNGPLPTAVRHALKAGGSTAFSQTEARSRAATWGRLCRDTVQTLAHQRYSASAARLGQLSIRLQSYRCRAVHWHCRSALNNLD